MFCYRIDVHLLHSPLVAVLLHAALASLAASSQQSSLRWSFWLLLGLLSPWPSSASVAKRRVGVPAHVLSLHHRCAPVFSFAYRTCYSCPFFTHHTCCSCPLFNTSHLSFMGIFRAVRLFLMRAGGPQGRCQEGCGQSRGRHLVPHGRNGKRSRHGGPRGHRHQTEGV